MFAMQCAEFENRLNRLLDHRLPPEGDEALTAHAHGCDDCSDLLHAQQRLLVGLKQGRSQPSAEFAEKVVAQRHLHVSRRRTVWRNAGWGMLLASAASLGGLALMAMRSGEFQPDVGQKQSVKKAGGSSGLAMANIGTSQETTEAKPDEKLGMYFVALENIATQISDSREFDEMSESLEPGIKPIRSSFTIAFDALRRTLPRGKDNRPTKPDAGANWLPELPAIS
jgi:hypothetical protein